jgi:hypothetical protein
MNEHSILDTMPFGKYKGELVKKIIENDEQYIFWAVCNTSFRIDDNAAMYLEKIRKQLHGNYDQGHYDDDFLDNLYPDYDVHG